MLSWKRTLSIGLILIMLASAVVVFNWVEADPTRASPVLSNQSVSPSSGYTDTLFNFTVRYTDTDNDTPLFVEVVIGGTHTNMTEVTGGNGTYATGRTFYYSTYLYAGNIDYFFTSQNVLRESARLPGTGNYTLNVQSRTVVPRLTNQAYTPTRPTDQDNVNFTVVYSHANGTSPLYVNLNVTDWLDRSIGVYNMTISGSNYTAGVTFNRSIRLNSGKYYYKFEGMDTNNTSVVLPSTSTYIVWIYSSSNNTSPALSNSGKWPTYHDEGDIIKFWTYYTDNDGDTPVGVWLYYYPQNETWNETIVNMTVGSGNVTLSVNCTATITAPANGTYDYYYYTEDGATGSGITSVYQFVVGNRPRPPRSPYLSEGNNYPESPTANDTINFTVKYRDETGQYLPFYVKLNIANETGIFTNYTMIPDHTNASREITYHYNLKLANDTYSYYFNSMIDKYHSFDPTSGYHGVTVTAQTSPPPRYPYLHSGHHSPQDPVANDTVTFAVIYVDPNGQHTPDYVRLSITQAPGISPYYDMKMGWGDISTGLRYYINLTLPAYGYLYYFKAFVGNYTTETDPVQLSVPNGTTPPVDHSPVLGTSSHHPVSPVSGSNITFSITYSDGDNDAPRFIKLHINEITSSRPYSVFNMTWSGTNYVYGVTASYVLTLTTGNYSYYFTASSNNFTISKTQGGLGFNLVVVNNYTPPPQQDRAPTLTNPRMSVASPLANQTLWFYITYTDADNSPPTYVKFHLLGGSGANYLNFTMTAPRGTYSNGVTYTYSISLLAGTYYYYFTTASTNYTVTYPSSGTRSFTVSARTQPPPPENRSNIGARIVYDPDQASIDVTDQDEDITVTMGATGEDFFEIEISSESGEDRVIVIGLDPDMFDVNSPDDIIVKVDGKEIRYQYVADPADWDGSEPAFYLEYTEAGAILYVLLPEADTHTITAKVPSNTGGKSDNFWYYVIAIIIILVIAAAISISLLTMAQKKRIQEYYEDFDTGVRDNKIASGRLMDEDDLEWDDLIEVEE